MAFNLLPNWHPPIGGGQRSGIDASSGRRIDPRRLELPIHCGAGIAATMSSLNTSTNLTGSLDP